MIYNFFLPPPAYNYTYRVLRRIHPVEIRATLSKNCSIRLLLLVGSRHVIERSNYIKRRDSIGRYRGQQSRLLVEKQRGESHRSSAIPMEIR